MFLGTQAEFGVRNFLGVQVSGLPESFSIRPINQQIIEHILLDELTEEDIDTIRFAAEEGEENREAKWAKILPRLIRRLKTELLLAEDPIVLVEQEPDSVDVQLLGPRLRVHLHLLRLP